MARRTAARSVAMPAAPKEDPFRVIRWLIWLYFALLLLEGALRKWAVPQLANPLLLIRDPVVLAIYALAFARNIFPLNKFIVAIVVLQTICVVTSLFGPFANFGVALFGWRCNVLHFPLVFVMARVIDFEDVKRLGQWVLIAAIPMTVLVAIQFRSPANAFVNAGAGLDAAQITFTGDRVRPSGTFSFVSGIVYFYALVTAFLLYGLVEKRTYPIWLTSIVALCVPVALAVSGSRSTVAMSAIVVMALVVALFLRPALLAKAMKLVAVGCILVLLAGSLAVFQSVFSEGMEAFAKRMAETENVEGGFDGFVSRFLGMFTKALHMTDIPLLGYGIGVGTNVGAKLLMGHIDYVLAEDEWERVIAESGPILGATFLLIRVLLAAQLGLMAARAARLGHFLPLLLIGACGVPIVNGQLGQSTTLGFTCFVAGLCLASMHLPQHLASAVIAAKQPARYRPPKVLAMRAAVAARKAAARGNAWTQKLLDPTT
jgi:hypothetical protein